jgi:beta-glucosidase
MRWPTCSPESSSRVATAGHLAGLRGGLPSATPVNGELPYDEGLLIGYRWYLATERTPAFPFGHGLGYTTWAYEDITVDGDSVGVTVRNSGSRPGREVVQLYASRPDSAVERPPRWLVGCAAVEAAAGEQ